VTRRTSPAPGQLDLFADAAPETPAAPHQVGVSWGKNPDPRAWARDPATLRPYPVSPDHPFHLLYQAHCSTCGWHGIPATHQRENTAVEEAMDHAWPGWRNLPAVPAKPNQGNPAKWLYAAAALYPPGWIISGGPVRTVRAAPGNRHWFDKSLHFWNLGVPA
jgi:Family of unknown function (DUF6349)